MKSIFSKAQVFRYSNNILHNSLKNTVIYPLSRKLEIWKQQTNAISKNLITKEILADIGTFCDKGELSGDALTMQKAFTTILAKSLDPSSSLNCRELSSSAYLSEDLSLDIQTILSLFVSPHDDAHNVRGNEIIKKYLAELDIDNNYTQIASLVIDPDNTKNKDFFYQYNYLGYDKMGENGVIANDSNNFLNNQHNFFYLSSILNLIRNPLPIVFNSIDKRVSLGELLCSQYVRPITSNFTIGARGNRTNEPIHTGYFGAFSQSDNSSFIFDRLHISNEKPTNFPHSDKWKSGFSLFQANQDAERLSDIKKNTFFVAGVSGTTLEILFTFIQVQKFKLLIEGSLIAEGSKADGNTLDMDKLNQDILKLSTSLISWMGLAGDHSVGEILMALFYVDSYIQSYMAENGNLYVANKKEATDLMQSVADRNTLLQDYLTMLDQIYPSTIQNFIEDVHNYVEQLKS